MLFKDIPQKGSRPDKAWNNEQDMEKQVINEESQNKMRDYEITDFPIQIGMLCNVKGEKNSYSGSKLAAEDLRDFKIIENKKR